jgi:CRP/FNR family transcriptional regulator, cyclic AMP receptor protein
VARGVPPQVISALRAISLFSDCNDKELEDIANLGTQLRIAPGTDVTRQGAVGSELIVIVAGNARCLIDGAEVAQFGPGDFFGEMSLIDNNPRSATVVADSDLEALVLDRREFKDLVDASPKIAWKMLVSMARRLRNADKSIHG